MKTGWLVKVHVLVMGVLIGTAHADEGLADLMRSMQYFSHKLSLSIDAGNIKLAGFYAHEVEEVIEGLEKSGEHKGKPIGALVKTILVPHFEILEKGIKSSDMKAATVAFDQMLEACNKCHVNTQHGFIKVQRTADNPYMQSFD